MSICLINWVYRVVPLGFFLSVFMGVFFCLLLPWFCQIQSGPRATRTPGANMMAVWCTVQRCHRCFAAAGCLYPSVQPSGRNSSSSRRRTCPRTALCRVDFARFGTNTTISSLALFSGSVRSRIDLTQTRHGASTTARNRNHAHDTQTHATHTQKIRGVWFDG